MRWPASYGRHSVHIQFIFLPAGVLVSTSQNPTTLGDFVQVNGPATGANTGDYCLPFDFSKSNLTGLTAGQNLTIQVSRISESFLNLY